MLKPILKTVAVATLSTLAFAQTASKAPATSTPSKTAPAKTTTATPAKTTSTPAKAAATPAKTTPAPAKTQAAKPAAPRPSAVKEEPKTEAKAPLKSAKTAGRRDPFISPVRVAEEKNASSSACLTGARCLVIDQVVLKGVVKTQQGWIAMVENSAKKQYNLREKDPVMNGSVYKITQDSVIFRENVIDNLGRSTTKEVVKRVTAPVV